MNQVLNDYIKKARESGQNNEQIKRGLLGFGWKEEDINNLLRRDFNREERNSWFKALGLLCAIIPVIYWILIVIPSLKSSPEGAMGLVTIIPVTLLFFIAALVFLTIGTRKTHSTETIIKTTGIHREILSPAWSMIVGLAFVLLPFIFQSYFYSFLFVGSFIVVGGALFIFGFMAFFK